MKFSKAALAAFTAVSQTFVSNAAVAIATRLASSQDGDGHIVGFDGGSAVSAYNGGIIPPQFPVVYAQDGSKVPVKTRGGAPGHVVLRGRRLAVSFRQVGQDIDGEAAGDGFGSVLAMSTDGTRIAVGAANNDGNGDSSGHVRVFQLDNGIGYWVQVGGDIDGEAAWDQLTPVGMSGDGTRIAVGACCNDGNGFDSGHVRVYEWSGTDWVKRFEIDGRGSDDRFGGQVKMSMDGTHLAVAAVSDDGNGDEKGHVRVYHQLNEGHNWVQLGNTLSGEGFGDYFGQPALAISANGTRLAIGARNNDGNGAYSGHVRMFGLNNNNDWQQLGNDIDGLAGDYFGFSVAMSADGTRVAIGAVGRDKNGFRGVGIVQVYHQLSEGDNWVQLGTTISEETPTKGWGMFGASVAMSMDGTRLAIGAPYTDGNGSSSGNVMMFEWNNDEDDWGQLGKISGEAAADFSGGQGVDQLAMSADGTRIAIGATGNDGGGEGSGHVRVWDLVFPTASPTSAPTSASTSAGPWDVNFIDVDADFSDNSEVAFEYEVGVGHAFRSELLLQGCEVHVNDSLYNSSDDIQPINDTYLNLTRTYDFKMTEVAQSNVWNTSTNKLAVCQKLHLWLPDPDGDPTTADAMDIFTDVREIEIEFDLEANFDTIVNLAPGTTESVNQTVDFQTAVRGYKCNGGDTNPFVDDATELAPNEELAICVVSTDANVEIDELVNMNSQQGATTVPIVTGGVANIAGITSKVKLDDGPTTNGIVVKTFLPLNKFTFAVNEEVTISGSVTMRLIGRRLQVERKLRTLAGEDFSTDDGPKEAAYQVKVELKGADSVVQGDGIPLGSSAGHATTKYAAALGLISIVTANFM